MKKLFYIFVTACFLPYGLSIAAACSEEKALNVIIAKKTHIIPFTGETPIRAIKSAIYNLEGIFEEEQMLIASVCIREKGLIKLHRKLLKDNKTCAYYNLQNRSHVECYLKMRCFSQ